ncbi:hypothetical protein CGI67_17490 [Vibrio parahaemolyticus]|nr:hypothetical protein HB39_05325 [Vibrio parahaemolyticus]TOI08230.1 hypothetical protein CGI67_17490 [Vibrio parahaemolyticus]
MGKLGNRQCGMTQYKTECIEKYESPPVKAGGDLFHSYQCSDSFQTILIIQQLVSVELLLT